MKKYIVGNWKMNHELEDIELFFRELDLPKELNCETWIAPQSMHITAVRNGTTTQQKPIYVGGQNICQHPNGAYTGENSASSLKDIGCTFTLVGHSERRTHFKESNELLNKKLLHALSQDLTVIFCIGETLEERKNGMTDAVVKNQLEEGLKEIKIDDLSRLIIAYEPVWAIGTGEVATPEQAESAHQTIRNWFKENLGDNAVSVPILYGGSLKPENAEGILCKANIDGALVGGASLKGKDFTVLSQIASKFA